MREPLISVIVPIYKVEKYLTECVDSIINQSYHNLEIILVDDGSPDNCGMICDEYKKKDNRIVVIHKENGGLSDARNVGLRAMHGDYLMFVDSDDWLPPNCVECLYHLISSYHAELAIGSSDRIDENGNILSPVENIYSKTEVFNREQAFQDMCSHGCSAWGRLYKRDIHEGICFPKGEINEDEAIVLQILERCENVVVTEQVIYHYRCRSESITTNIFSKKKLVWIKHCSANYRFIRNAYPQLEQYAAARYRGSLMWAITELAMMEDVHDYEIEKKQIMKEIKENEKRFQQIAFSSKKEKIRYWIVANLGFEFYRITLQIKRRKGL